MFPFDIIPLLPDPKPVSIPDANLAAAIGKHLGLAPGSPITQLDMLGLRRLYFSGDYPNRNPEKEITNLTGLEHATNLEYLELPFNQISDITPLAGLKKLRLLTLSNNQISDASPVAGLTLLNSLRLDHNPISDITPFARLTGLTGLFLADIKIKDITPLRGLMNLGTLRLDDCQINDRMLTLLTEFPKLRQLMLGGNQIRDITPLARFTKIRFLVLDRNQIVDITPLKGLTNLDTLFLDRNQIVDITPLKGLTNLSALNLWRNQISNVSPLVGLINLEWMSLEDNPLSYLSIHTHIPTLQSNGVTVDFDNQAHPALLKISGDNQTGASFVSLSQPFVVEAQDENGSPLVGISVTFVVTAGGGTLSTTTTRTDPNGRAQTTLRLGPNLERHTVEVSAAGIEVPATFHAVSDTKAPPTIADVNNDGSVNVLDLILIAASLGQSGQHDADVNGDGVVSILDLVLAAGMFDDAAAAPSAQPQAPETLTAVEVQGWLTGARALEVRNTIMKRGFVVLEQLLVSLTPRETELLANYPNPFNPETWIPYRLAEDAFVTLTIYDGAGHVIRTLDVGHRIAAAYENRSKAVYWDGKNNLGEQVASGIYFYHLSAGEYSATRRRVILK